MNASATGASRDTASGIVANYGALALGAVAGLIVNAIIAWFYSVETLGVFNQVFAVYIVASQIGAAGVHLATLSMTGRHAVGTDAHREILASAVATVGATGAICGALLWVASGSISKALSSPDVADGLRIVALALPLIGISKCFQASFTAAGRMQAVALVQATRAAGLLIASLILAGIGASGPSLAWTFVVAEVAVLAAAGGALVRGDDWPGFGDVRAERMREILAFGASSLVGSALQELNIRIDLLIIGVLLDDRDVGIYSFAGLVAEGMLAAIAVVRNLIVPRLSVVLADSSHSGLAELVATSFRWTYAGAVGGAVAAVGGVWMALRVLYGAQSVYLQAVPLLAVLLCGIVVVAGIYVFDIVFIVAGRPGLHSLAVTIGVTANIALNLILIPMHGLTGAAVATAIATVVNATAIVVLAQWFLNVRLLPRRRV